MSTSFQIHKRIPDSKIYVTQGTLVDAAGVKRPQNKRPRAIVSGHHFNRRIEIIVPAQAVQATQAVVDRVFADACFYHGTLPLSFFLEGEFFNTHVKTGSCLVLSLSKIDQDDVFCIYNGILRLSLTRETYEKAGIVGRVSKFNKLRYIIELDLRDAGMFAGHKLFDRLLTAARESPLARPVACVANVGGASECMAAATRHELRSQTATFGPVAVPPFPRPAAEFAHTAAVTPPTYQELSPAELAQYYKSAHAEELLHLLEWTALVAVESPLVVADAAPSVTATYAVFESGRPAETVARIVVDGLVTSAQALAVFDALSLASAADSWTALTVYGFDDAPVSWHAAEHSFLLSGDNNYTVVVPPSADRAYIAFELVCNQDTHS
ncbi:ribonuclease P 40kDa subunit-domain-containing protein [Dipodascopsis tothii]|uniref:ribonuclease P 40kDa subunit-domain-containing protein n=1 Tax=Dipodascopsis tothii TaxID=44089 RepID=UPI0034CFED8B